MTTMKFDDMPSGIEKMTVEHIAKDSVQQAWESYEARPEYKEVNKHDMIEAMLPSIENEA